ncbi:flagellar basal-body rod protein FlgF [Altererythrobacter atlanticus]|uniref:Flagellar basal-body rod protein FlgF n=1 Tax=Croceibacterium atlanticum TaxID=1267766 RepID=A0A0F7KZC0_9SPHN|nr:flagellar basal body rod protein FlgF [Croceibacterium atlanticum]AKH44180.1 Flagellar basal-body rod protein FlgF [Croceibacterium atlanticum]MBB5732491.1 flagellar basal-body rod protein FlgF [Croceibacterium atlanticum]
MDRLIYTALSGMQSSMQQQRVIASNMANAQTLGFKAELLDQRPMTVKGDSLEVRAMQHAEVRGARMDTGDVIETGQPLDIAINGQAMLAVQADDGSEAYTRRGDLSISPTGLLVTGEGQPVMGDAGPITIPLGGKASIAPDGTVSVTDPAAPNAPAQDVGRIKLAGWQGSPVLKGLDGLFRVEGGGVLPRDEEASVTTGSLEQSNVKPTEVLVEMIDAQRLFAMRSKLIATASEVDESGSQLMRMT